jgi:DUF4097 and DUF4098 domain-containing protein YvlB
MRTKPLFIAIAFGMLIVAGCDADGNGLDKVNGSVNVKDGAHAGNASTVNGSIDIGRDAVIANADTVNGAITLGERAHAVSLETVNGGIELESAADVARDASTVNGSLQLASGSHVGGKLENVNGGIRLDHATVDGGVATLNGDVTIGSGSIVRGGLHVQKNHGFSISFDSRKPRIVIASGAEVDGTLQFDREVDLFVAPDAKIGKVVGATPQPYTGKTEK